MAEHVDDAELLDLEITGPTVPLPWVSSLVHVLRRYLTTATEPRGRRSHGGRARGLGQVAFLHGEHGTGKTHAIRYAFAESVGEADRTNALRLYVKAQDDDFTGLYRRLMSQVGRLRLRDLSQRFLGVLATDRAGSWPENWAEAEVLADVRENPERVDRLFAEMMVERGAVLEEQANELDRVIDDGEEFQRALTSLLNPALEDAAYAWLTGREIDPVDAERLGVSAMISDPDRCRFGLQLLATMCAKVGRPLIVVIDQCERLVLYGRANIGLLHSLVEKMPQDNGMLLLSGNEAAWRVLPPDLQQRFGSNSFDTSVMTPRQAGELLTAYLSGGAAGGEDDESYGGQSRDLDALTDAIRPFTVGAVRELLVLSGGNVRLFLQLSWQAFGRAQPGTGIDGEVVRISTRHHAPERDSVLQSVERWLLDEKVVFERGWRRGALTADFAVISNSGPRILIEVRDALFSADDAHEALGGDVLVEGLRARGWASQLILVVLGYASPEVLATARHANYEVVIFDDEHAIERLRETARGLGAPGESPAADPADLFVQLYDALPDDVFAGWTATQWVHDPEVRRLASEISEIVLELGRLDPLQVDGITSDLGDRGRFALLLGLDGALAHANPYGPYLGTPALASILVRYLVEGRFNKTTTGALLPRCSPFPPQAGRRTKDEFFGVHRIPSEHWDKIEHSRLASVHDAFFPAGEPVTVGCPPLLETYDDVELSFERQFGLTVYRLRPADSSALRTRIRVIMRRLDESGAHIAVLPEASLSDVLLEYWKEVAFDSASRDRSSRPLRYLLLGSGPLGSEDPPPNRAVLIDRWTGEELLVQDKLSGFTIENDQMRLWRLPNAPSKGVAHEYVTPGQRISLLDCSLGRLAVLINEDLSRSFAWEQELRSCGVSHLFVPSFSQPILPFRWEHQGAERQVTALGGWVTVANSMAVGAAIPDDELPGTRYTCLVAGPDLGDRRQYTVNIQFGTAAAADELAHLYVLDENGRPQLPVIYAGGLHEAFTESLRPETE